MMAMAMLPTPAEAATAAVETTTKFTIKSYSRTSKAQKPNLGNGIYVIPQFFQNMEVC
jgi:hypothetical protein